MQHVFLSPASQSPAMLQLRKCTAYTTHKEAGETENEFLAERKEKKKRNAETRSPVDEKDKKDMDDEKERDREKEGGRGIQRKKDLTVSADIAAAN